MTLYERLGGEGPLTAVVGRFYDQLAVNAVTAPFFAKADLDKQKKRQVQFLTLHFGGPNHYEGKDMKTVHLHLKIGNKEFDTAWDIMHESLQHFKVPENLIGEVKKVFYSVHNDVVTV